jgi:hypothetical protein
MTGSERPTEENSDIEDVIWHLERLSETVDDEEKRKELHRAIGMVEGLSFAAGIKKYTMQDIAQAFVGSIFLSMPFLIEDGVYEIARRLLQDPIFVCNVFLLSWSLPDSSTGPTYATSGSTDPCLGSYRADSSGFSSSLSQQLRSRWGFGDA